jgi:hypothetical protein
MPFSPRGVKRYFPFMDLYSDTTRPSVREPAAYQAAVEDDAPRNRDR